MNKDGRKMPKIFYVNWFRKTSDGKYMWPGFGENIRVLEWVFKRTDNEPNTAQTSPIGLIPSVDSFDLDGLKLDCKLEDILSIDKQFWMKEVNDIRQYFDEYINDSTPREISDEIDSLKKRVDDMK